MATLTINIPDSNKIDVGELQRKLSVYAEALMKSLKNNDANKSSESLSSIYGIGKIDTEESLDSLIEEALSERFRL